MTDDAPNPFEAILDQLLAVTPDAMGAIVCDYEGEAVAHRVGRRVPFPAAALDAARQDIPESLQASVDVPEYLLKIAGAGPCAQLAQLAEASPSVGAVEGFDARFDGMSLLVRRLPEAFYVVLALNGDAAVAPARRQLEQATPKLAELI